MITQVPQRGTRCLHPIPQDHRATAWHHSSSCPCQFIILPIPLLPIPQAKPFVIRHTLPGLVDARHQPLTNCAPPTIPPGAATANPFTSTLVPPSFYWCALRFHSYLAGFLAQGCISARLIYCYMFDFESDPFDTSYIWKSLSSVGMGLGGSSEETQGWVLVAPACGALPH